MPYANPAALLLIPLAAASSAALLVYVRRRLYGRVYGARHPLAHVVVVRRRRSLLEAAAPVLRIAAIALVLAAAAAPYTPVSTPSSVDEYVRLDIEVRHKPLVVLAIDVSGSMVGEKLESAKRALYMFIDAVGDRVVLALIAFSDHIVYAVPPTLDKDLVRSSIERLEAGGGTMYAPPLVTAYTWAKPFRDVNSSVTIIFASDGLPADLDTEEYNRVLREYAENNISINTVFIYTPGLPEEENRAALHVLESMAAETGGICTGPRTADQLPAVYMDLAERARKSSVTVVARTTVDLETTHKVYEITIYALAALALYAASLVIRHLYQRTGF